MSEAEAQQTQQQQQQEPQEDDKRIVRLTSKDGDSHDLPASAAALSQLVKTTIECDDDDDDDDDDGDSPSIVEVPIPKVGSACLAKVVEFCIHQSEEPMVPIQTPLVGDTLEEIITQQWYRNFIMVEQPMIFELVTAANFMAINSLLDLACLRVSMDMMGKSTEEIRVMLNIPKMTAEEEAKARREHRWIFDD